VNQREKREERGAHWSWLPERRGEAGDRRSIAAGERKSPERGVGSPEGREPESTEGNESLSLGFGLEAFF
jgi:hypothetical protein